MYRLLSATKYFHKSNFEHYAIFRLQKSAVLVFYNYIHSIMWYSLAFVVSDNPYKGDPPPLWSRSKWNRRIDVYMLHNHAKLNKCCLRLFTCSFMYDHHNETQLRILQNMKLAAFLIIHINNYIYQLAKNHHFFFRKHNVWTLSHCSRGGHDIKIHPVCFKITYEK